MKRLLVFTVVSTLTLGMAGCQCCNWFGARAAAPGKAAGTYGTPAPSAAAPVATGAAMPPAAPGSSGAGCTSCGNSLPVLTGPQGYAPVLTN